MVGFDRPLACCYQSFQATLRCNFGSENPLPSRARLAALRGGCHAWEAPLHRVHTGGGARELGGWNMGPQVEKPMGGAVRPWPLDFLNFFTKKGATLWGSHWLWAHLEWLQFCPHGVILYIDCLWDILHHISAKGAVFWCWATRSDDSGGLSCNQKTSCQETRQKNTHGNSWKLMEWTSMAPSLREHTSAEFEVSSQSTLPSWWPSVVALVHHFWVMKIMKISLLPAGLPPPS